MKNRDYYEYMKDYKKPSKNLNNGNDADVDMVGTVANKIRNLAMDTAVMNSFSSTTATNPIEK